MVYESPAIQYQGLLTDLVRQLIPISREVRLQTDVRIVKLLQFIDIHAGSIDWDLRGACRELKLNISGAYAGRLFKRLTGLGVREYAKRKRLHLAADRLKRTNLPIKVIAAEVGYYTPPDFTRIFKEQFRLSPTEYRKRRAVPTETRV